jgi:hypothetical protein
MHIALPTNSNGIPTKTHQKYLGGPKLPKDEKKLPIPMTIKRRPMPAVVGPRVRRTVLLWECLGSILDSSLIGLFLELGSLTFMLDNPAVETLSGSAAKLAT